MHGKEAKFMQTTHRAQGISLRKLLPDGRFLDIVGVVDVGNRHEALEMNCREYPQEGDGQ